jgi:acylphosphatase
MADLARRYIFSGRVQGVGFRNKTTEFAEQIGLNGFVRNLSDGRVELLVEGEQARINSLLEALKSRFEGNLTAVEELDAPYEARTRFEVLR